MLEMWTKNVHNKFMVLYVLPHAVLPNECSINSLSGMINRPFYSCVLNYLRPIEQSTLKWSIVATTFQV